jgi:Ca2+-binding EF-hand superfamily protein
MISSCVREFDRGGKGYLRRAELVASMTGLLGVKPSRFEVEQVLLRVGRVFKPACQLEGDDSALDSSDSDDSKDSNKPVLGVSIEDFEHIMLNKVSSIDSEDIIKYAFQGFDAQTKGFLTFEDTVNGFHLVLPTLSNQVILEAFHAADRDGDGRIGYAEFFSVMWPSSSGPPLLLE